MLLLLSLVAAAEASRCLRAGPSLFHLGLHLLILLELLLVLLGNIGCRDGHIRGLCAYSRLVLHVILILRHLVSARSSLHLLAPRLLLVAVVLRWHLVASKAIIDEHATNIHAEAAVAAESGHAACHLLLHVEALNLDQVLHLLLTRWVLELTLHLLHRGLHGLVRLLHLELHVVEDAVKVDGVELDWHLHGRILLEVDQRCLSLLRIDHASDALDALPLLHGDLFAVEDHQLDEALDDDHAVVWLASDRIVDQGEVEEVGQLGELLNLEQLLDPVVRDVQGLQLLQLLDVGERLETVLVQLEDHDLVVRVETVDVDLADAILAEVKLAQLAELLEVLDLDDLVVGGMEDLQLLEGAVLETVEVLQLVAGDVEELQVWHAVEAALEVPVLDAWLHEEGLDLVLPELQDLELRQVAEASQRAHMVVGEVQLAQVWALTLIEHVLEVAQLARGEVQVSDVLHGTTCQPRSEDLLSQTSRERLLRLLVLLVVDREAVEDSELSQVEDAVDAVVVAELGAHQVARDVEDDQPLQVLQLDRLLHVADEIVAEVELHEALQVLEAIQAGDLVVLQGQLREAHQTLHVRDPLDLV